MGTKQFKAESKRLLDLMINSIYTNKEIFLRELISNASDAIDKLYYKSLTDSSIKLNREDFKIKIDLDRVNRTLTITDNGIGMNEKELETNLGTIAKSGSLAFKEANEKKENIDIIGQFGVGFYSAFMVSDCIEVKSKAYGEEKAFMWKSKGAEGYEIEECEKEDVGTIITLHIKPDTEDEKYSEFIEDYKIEGLVKRYSDYIRYPILLDKDKQQVKPGTENELEMVKETKTLNSMIPLWKKAKKDITEDEYNTFYMDKFYDIEKPFKTIHTQVEGQFSYNALLYIPAHAPYGYYTGEYEKGLQLYSNGVLIMDKCNDLLPEYFGFVKGLVDSPDLSLNISREMLQHDRQLKVIEKSIEKKVKQEIENLLKTNRPEYEKFYDNFGLQLKAGCYNYYGANKEKLQDLLLFHSSVDKKLVTLKEYVERMKEGQDSIYYACGESIDKIALLPQVEGVVEKGFEVLYCAENIDEFVMQTLMEYEGKKFKNVCTENIDLESEEEKKALEKVNEENKDMFSVMKEVLPVDVLGVRYTHRLKNHPVCLSSEGDITIEMEKVINSMPTDQSVKAKTVLEINEKHEIAKKLQELYAADNKEELKNYAKVLYAQARLIEGLNVDNPTELTNLICGFMSK